MTIWHIETFTVSEEDAKISMMRATFSFSSSRRYVPPGTYRRLIRNGQVIMSDTPDELRDLREFRRQATGRVLINGLGLGCAVEVALAKLDVISIDVIEIDPAVIELVQFGDDRVKIICADAYKWQAAHNERWNTVWHDIWDDICADNLPEMTRLHRKYGRRCDWQGSWCRAECQRAARNWRKDLR